MVQESLIGLVPNATIFRNKITLIVTRFQTNMRFLGTYINKSGCEFAGFKIGNLMTSEVNNYFAQIITSDWGNSNKLEPADVKIACADYKMISTE